MENQSFPPGGWEAWWVVRRKKGWVPGFTCLKSKVTDRGGVNNFSGGKSIIRKRHAEEMRAGKG